MKAPFFILFGLAITVMVAAYLGEQSVKTHVVENIRVRIGAGETFPDPANVSSTGKWYYLDLVSSGITRFDHKKGAFIPALAERWENDSKGTHTFYLRKDAAFHDGTPLTAQDVVASIERLLIKRSSTHLPLWEYIEGCADLKSVADSCSGLKAVDDHTVQIKLKINVESFDLQLASPETAIWWKGDVLKDGVFQPTKFSGPYSAQDFSKGSSTLIRNSLNPISKEFPDSPRRISVVAPPMDKSNQALIDGELDLLVRTHDPLGEPNWSDHGISTFGSAMSTLVYLQGVKSLGQQSIGRDLLESLWSYAPKGEAYPADSFLPYSLGYALKKDQLLNLFPAKSIKQIRIAVPWDFFCKAFLDRIQAGAKEVGTDITYVVLAKEPWFNAASRKGDVSGFDYVLVPYAASERYPAVQVRYLAGTLDLPIDLKQAESPGLTPAKIKILNDAEKWLAASQHVVPLYFLRSQMTYNSKFDIGDQPPNDADIELWRVKRK